MQFAVLYAPYFCSDFVAKSSWDDPHVGTYRECGEKILVFTRWCLDVVFLITQEPVVLLKSKCASRACYVAGVGSCKMLLLLRLG